MKLKKLSNYGLKMHIQSQPNPKQLLAFDIGTVHTGCAVSCFNIKKPYFLKSIKISHKFTSNDFSQYYHKLQRQILKITKQNRPTAIIFGIPQRMIQRQYYVYAQIGMRSLIEGFLQRYELKQNEEKNDQQIFHYTLIDERWSTRQASQKLKDIQLIYAKWGHLHKQKQLLDGMAAMKILERYLDYYNKQ